MSLNTYIGFNNAGDQVLAWSMLQAEGYPNHNYVQTGYAEYSPSEVDYIMYASGPNYSQQQVTKVTWALPGQNGVIHPQQGTRHSYSVLWGNDQNYYTGRIDNQGVVDQNGVLVQYDPGFAAHEADGNAETHTASQQMLGDSVTPLDMQSGGWVLKGSQNWQAFNANGGAGDVNVESPDGVNLYQGPSWSANSGIGAAGNNEMTVWDWACPPHETAYQSSGTNYLYTYDSGGATYRHAGMEAGTSPSITATPGSGWVAAYQDSGTNRSLSTDDSSNHSAITAYGMQPGTSPSITTLSNGSWIVAFQSNNHQLWTYTSAGVATNTLQGIASGTNPSITATASSGWVIAFQDNNHYLHTYDSASRSNSTGLGMLGGTNPAIATLSTGSWMAAAQSNNYQLWTRSSSGTSTNTHEGMLSNFSPSITWTAGGGWVIAFEDNNDYLRTWDSSSSTIGTGLGMPSSSSNPSITTIGTGHGWEIAFEDNVDHLHYYSSFAGATGTTIGMLANTSPGNAPPS